MRDIMYVRDYVYVHFVVSNLQDISNIVCINCRCYIGITIQVRMLWLVLSTCSQMRGRITDTQVCLYPVKQWEGEGLSGSIDTLSQA